MGNILTANGHTYTYGNADWKDLLTAYDGETISYDASGNPTSYYNGARWTFTWNNGRSLTRAVSGSTSVDYTYDLTGLRNGKTVGDVVHKYYYAGSKLMRETYGSNTLDFFYDASGMPYALKYNGTVYYYVTNLQGDVIQIVDANGGTVASYEYDPYGKVISATGTLAETNPIRYRGYYYDKESGLYYLQSRYYDPTTCRFLNADAFASTGQGILGNNMFTYCGNNPPASADSYGFAAVHVMVSVYTGNSVSEDITEIADTPLEQVQGIINGQALLPYSDYRIGLGSYRNSGCSYIAMYNAMQLIDQPQSLAIITMEMFMYGAVALGAGGTGPWAAAAYLNTHGVDYIGSFRADKLTANISEGAVITFTAWYPGGWHAITALYTNGEYRVFNRYSDDSKDATYSKLSDAYSNGWWVYGFLLNP